MILPERTPEHPFPEIPVPLAQQGSDPVEFAVTGAEAESDTMVPVKVVGAKDAHMPRPPRPLE